MVAPEVAEQLGGLKDWPPVESVILAKYIDAQYTASGKYNAEGGIGRSNPARRLASSTFAECDSNANENLHKLIVPTSDILLCRLMNATTLLPQIARLSGSFPCMHARVMISRCATPATSLALFHTQHAV